MKFCSIFTTITYSLVCTVVLNYFVNIAGQVLCVVLSHQQQHLPMKTQNHYNECQIDFDCRLNYSFTHFISMIVTTIGQRT